MKLWPLAACLVANAALPSIVHAQEVGTNIFETVIPFTASGRNESVADRPHPEYQQVGYRAGGFMILPSATLNVGYTDNVYQSAGNQQSEAFGAFIPRVTAESTWSRNSLRVQGGANLLRYANATERDEDGWFINAAGRYDISSNAALNFGARTGRQYETRFTGSSVLDTRSAVPLQATLVQTRGDFNFARLKLVVAGDYSDIDYKSIENNAGVRVSQDDRDRSVVRGTGHLQYEVSPDTGVFVQAIYTNIDYRSPTAGFIGRDSHQWRGLAGVSLDVSALIRGTFGVGYEKRDFVSPIYRDVSGFSMDGRLQYFPSQLTTVTLAVRRDVEDATRIAEGGYLETAFALRADHELLRNLVLNAGGEYAHDQFHSIGTIDVYRFAGGARYLFSRLLTANIGVSYTTRADNITSNFDVHEVRASVGLTIHP